VTRPARYLLDTNILSDLVKHPHGVIAKAIARVGEDAVFTSIIVACELRFGVAKKGSVRLAEHVDAILAEMDVTPFDHPLTMPMESFASSSPSQERPSVQTTCLSQPTRLRWMPCWSRQTKRSSRA